MKFDTSEGHRRQRSLKVWHEGIIYEGADVKIQKKTDGLYPHITILDIILKDKNMSKL